MSARIKIDRKGLNAAIEAMACFTSYDTPSTLAEDCIRAYLAALSTEPGEAEGWQPTHRHKKRGMLYRLDGYGEIQTTAPIGDYAKVAIYRAEDGKTWVRPVSEFNDGRFEALEDKP